MSEIRRLFVDSPMGLIAGAIDRRVLAELRTEFPLMRKLIILERWLNGESRSQIGAAFDIKADRVTGVATDAGLRVLALQILTGDKD